MADSDTALAALNQARQWVLENASFDVSHVEVDGEYLIVDFRVTGPGGTVWFDDRNRILKPRLRTPDGTFTATTEYQRPNGETLYLSQEQFNALTRAQQRALTPTGNTGQRANFTFAPRIAILRDLLHTAKIATQNWTVPHVMRDADGNLLGDTLTVFSQNDGAIRSSNANIATARSGSGLSLDVSGDLAVDAGVSGGTFAFSMALLSFDTSPLGAGATITGAVVSLAGTGSNETSTNNPTIQIKFKDYGSGDPTTGDFFNIATTGWTALVDQGSKALNTWDGTAAAYNAFSDAGNYGSYSLTGTTRMVVGNSLFPTGTPTGGNSFFFQSSDEAGTTSDPKLVITYTPGSATATGSATFGAVTATGSGTQSFPGTGSPTLAAITASGTGVGGAVGTGSPTLAAISASGSGTHALEATGTGAPSLAPITAAGTGIMQPSGTGSPSLSAITATGSGQEIFTATGTATLGAISVTGTGVESYPGTAAIALAAITATGAGTETISGSGAVTFAAVTTTGTGSATFPGTGAVTLPAVRAAGSGTETFTGSAAITIAAISALGVGVHVVAYLVGNARYAPTALSEAWYAPTGTSSARYATQMDTSARYAVQADTAARYEPEVDTPARYAPIQETEARYD